VKAKINDIAAQIVRAKEMKGTVTLNNGKSNGGTWRHPALDLALNQQEGGETGTRFY
jgi:hypothetical protein